MLSFSPVVDSLSCSLQVVSELVVLEVVASLVCTQEEVITMTYSAISSTLKITTFTLIIYFCSYNIAHTPKTR